MFRDSKEATGRLDSGTHQKTPSSEVNLKRKSYLNRVLTQLNSHETPENINNFIEEILKAYAANSSEEAALCLEPLTFKIKLDPITEADLALFYLESQNFPKAKLHELHAIAGLESAKVTNFLNPSELSILNIQVGILLARNANHNKNRARHYLAKGLYSDCELAFLYPKLIGNIILTTVKMSYSFGNFFPAVFLDAQTSKQIHSSSYYEKLVIDQKNTIGKFYREESKPYLLLLYNSIAYWLIYSGNDTNSYKITQKENLLKKYKKECLLIEETITARLNNDSVASNLFSNNPELGEDLFTELDKDFFNDDTVHTMQRKPIVEQIPDKRLETLIQLNTKPIDLLRLVSKNINDAFTLIVTDQTKNLPEAKRLLIDAINTCTISADGFYVLASILLEEKNYLESIATNKKGEEIGIVVGEKVEWNIKKNANFFYAHFYLGNFKEALPYAIEFLKEHIGSSINYANREPFLNFWNKLHPVDNAILLTKNAENLAKTFYKQKKYQKALEYLTAAIHQNQHKTSLYLLRAQILETTATNKQDCLEALFNLHLAEWLIVKKYSVSFDELEKDNLQKHCQTLNTKLKSLSENTTTPSSLEIIDFNSPDFDNEKIAPNKITKKKPKKRKPKNPTIKMSNNNESKSDREARPVEEQNPLHSPTQIKPTLEPKHRPNQLADFAEQDFQLPVLPLVTKSNIGEVTLSSAQSSTQVDTASTTIPQINLPPEGKFILNRLKERGYTLTFAVGGVVRDQLIDCENINSDIDIVTSASFEQLKEIFPLVEFPKQHFHKNGKLLQVYCDNQKIDIWHSEKLHQSQIDVSHNKITSNNKHILEILKCDAETRDFNISTLYADENGNVLDPFEVYECETIDTLIEPKDLFSKSPICMLRAIYLSFKVGFPLAERVSSEIKQHINSLSSLSIAELRPLLGRISHLSVSNEISKEFDKLNFVNVLLPYFNSFSSQEIIDRLASNAPLNWIFANLVIDSSVTKTELTKLETIEDMQLKFQALQNIYENIKTNASAFKTSKQFKELFPHEDAFSTLLQKAVEANPTLNRLMIERDVLEKTLPLIQNKTASSAANVSTITQEQHDETPELPIEPQNIAYPYMEEQFVSSSEYYQSQMDYVYPPNPYLVPQQFIYPPQPWQMPNVYAPESQYPQAGFWFHPEQFQQAQFFNAGIRQESEHPATSHPNWRG